VTSVGAPSESDIISFLLGLRKYRAGLLGPGQTLLDSLVAAGLGRTPGRAPEGDFPPYWCVCAAGSYGGSDRLGAPCAAEAVSWETTPWGLAWRARYCW
jgi:hypothetical protein